MNRRAKVSAAESGGRHWLSVEDGGEVEDIVLFFHSTCGATLQWDIHVHLKPGHRYLHEDAWKQPRKKDRA